MVCFAALAGCAAGFTACSGDSSTNAPSVDASAIVDAGALEDATLDSSASVGDAARGSDATAQPDGDAGPVASLSMATIDLGTANCGSTLTASLPITNAGGGTLAVAAQVVGSAFTLSPTSLELAAGATGTLTVTANVPSSAPAITPIEGSLALVTSDPKNANLHIPVEITPHGPVLQGKTTYAFPTTEVGIAAKLTLSLANTGDLPATFTMTGPGNAAFVAPALDGGLITVAPGASFQAPVTFTPTSPVTFQASAQITTSGAFCGTPPTTVTFTGTGVAGSLAGWPSGGTVDFGAALCGGAAPPTQQFTLTNTSATTEARVTVLNLVQPTGASGCIGSGTFSVQGIAAGSTIPAGGSVGVTIGAPAIVAGGSCPSAIDARLSFQTAGDAQPLALTLTERPSGAVLAFTSTQTLDFGSVPLLQSAAKNVSVSNVGNLPATVTLTSLQSGSGAGVADALADGGTASIFTVSTPSFVVPPSGTQAEQVTFQPVHAGASNGLLAITVDPTTRLCAALPQPLLLTGTGSGGGPVVAPQTLTFGATCGGAAPALQTVILSNRGDLVFHWTLSAITGPGASQYALFSGSPSSGSLGSQQSTTITFTAAAIPSPAPDPNAADLEAQVTISTDVPLDPPHVVALREVPLGDHISVSVGNLSFGKVPTQTMASQGFTLTNSANPGSPDARITMAINPAGGPYSVQGSPSIPVGATVAETVDFEPTLAGPLGARLAFQTSDALCTPLPAPIVLGGTGTSGSLALSAQSLTFGADPTDLSGLVDCGRRGTPQTVTLTNQGNQDLAVVSAKLAKGAASPYALSGPGIAAQARVPMSGGTTTITITPAPIPAAVSNPNDPSPFLDDLVVTTNVPGDAAHTVHLVMQARGAVIVGAPPQGPWNFGTIGAGSIATYTTPIRNAGNAPASVALAGLSQPTIFALQVNPTTVPANGVVDLVGQFAPPAQDGVWNDQGTLVVSADTAICQLPASWVGASVSMTGASNANPPASISGSLSFATTDCGAAPPSGLPLTLTNATNQGLAYTLKFNSGTYYGVTDPNAGVLSANGTATIVVTPKKVTPGPGVLPGAAPYADDLVINVTGTAGGVHTTFVVPISWALSGAVLALPDGTGPNGQGFYVADTTSGATVGIDNTGNEAASVAFSISPAGAFSVQPSPPITVIPGVRALPSLVGGASFPACPQSAAGVAANAMATFVYSGPVCQPLPLGSIAVFACKGTYP
jgi:hypothetical protein